MKVVDAVNAVRWCCMRGTATPVGVFLAERSLHVRPGEGAGRPEGEMAFERYRLPTLIGHGGMGKVVAAAAATIALAPFSVLATTPGVAQAARWVPSAWVGADSIPCRDCRLPAAQYRISTPRVYYVAGAARPAQVRPSTVPVQTPQVVLPSPPPPRTIPMVAAEEELTRSWWPLALRYGLLVIAVCFVAWMIHRFAKMWSAPMTASAPRPARRVFGRGGIAGVLRARKRMALVEAGHRCAIPTCRHPTTEIAHIVPESHSHDDSFEKPHRVMPEMPKERNRSAVDPHVQAQSRDLEQPLL